MFFLENMKSPKFADKLSRGNNTQNEFISQFQSNINENQGIHSLKSPKNVIKSTSKDNWASYSKYNVLTPQQRLNDEKRKTERRVSEFIKPESKFGDSYEINDKVMIDQPYDKIILEEYHKKSFTKYDYVMFGDELGIDLNQQQDDIQEMFNVFKDFNIDIIPFEGKF